MRGVGVVLLLLAFAVIARAGNSDEMTQQINRDVKMVLQRTQTPGATILVIRDGEVLYRKAMGLRDLDHRFPVRMDTHYEIASLYPAQLKGRQVVDGKRWFDYVIEFGPGSTFRFSVAMDDEGRVASLGFKRF